MQRARKFAAFLAQQNGQHRCCRCCHRIKKKNMPLYRTPSPPALIQSARKKLRGDRVPHTCTQPREKKKIQNIDILVEYVHHQCCCTVLSNRRTQMPVRDHTQHTGLGVENETLVRNNSHSTSAFHTRRYPPLERLAARSTISSQIRMVQPFKSTPEDSIKSGRTMAKPMASP